MERYKARLSSHFTSYKAEHHPELPNGVWQYRGKDLEYAHILPKDEHRLNILPAIRDHFWSWFGKQHGEVKLHRFFHHLNSSQALCFNLFFPFLKEDGAMSRNLLNG